MNTKFIDCPLCKRRDAVPFIDEVDIGVGVQQFLRGITCPDCGDLSLCCYCGAVEGHEQHRPFCDTIKNLTFKQ